VSHQVETGPIGERTGHDLDRGNVLYWIEPPRHEEPGGPPQAGAQFGRRQSGRTARQHRSHPRYSLDLFQQALPVKQIADRCVNDPIGIGHRVQKAPAQARVSGQDLAVIRDGGDP
jgi:hypothetical protein